MDAEKGEASGRPGPTKDDLSGNTAAPNDDRAQGGYEEQPAEVIPVNPFAYLEYENKTQLKVGVALSLTMNIIYVIPHSFALLFFTMLTLTNSDGAMLFGLVVSAILFTIGLAAGVLDCILCCYLDRLQRSSYTLTFWIVLYLVYMVIVVAELVLLVVGLIPSQEKNYDKLWLSNPDDQDDDDDYYNHYGRRRDYNDNKLPIFKVVTRQEYQNRYANNYNSQILQDYRTVDSWMVAYQQYRAGATACLVIGIIFLAVRGYFHYIAFKVRKALQAVPPLQTTGMVFSPIAYTPAVIPQYYVGHDGGGGAPYYYHSNAYPPLRQDY